MNLYKKRALSYKAQKSFVSALMIGGAFFCVYLTFVFGVEKASDFESDIYFPANADIISDKVEAVSTDSKLPIDTAFERKTPLYLSEKSGSSYNTLSVFFHESKTLETIELEEYVLGVLLAEMPTSYGLEALKAQAVACRTYAIYKAKNCAAHEGGGQLCTSSAHCQAYADFSKISAERMKIAKKAVDETKGIIMTYGGEPVLAVFHAASVENTRSSAEVWGGELPYLISVKTDESTFMNVKERRGHGVGMSQYGAECLASKGYDFYSILSHYYTGVEFSSV